jgi:hypothetical protein
MRTQTGELYLDPTERLFYPETVIEFILNIIQSDTTIDELCKKFNNKITISDISCPAYINSKTPHICNRRTNFKNMYGLCNYHHSRFMQDGSMLIGKQKDTYTQIYHEKINDHEFKKCRHPKCKTEIENGEYCQKHVDGDKVLCNKLLKNGKKCRRFKTKDNQGNRQEYCKTHL